MGIKLTQKDIRNNFFTIAAGYGELQTLLSMEGTSFYTAGVYGWNADVYIYTDRNAAIVTGYRPGSADVRLDYETARAWEKKAAKAKTDSIYSTAGDLREQLHKLVIDLIDETRANWIASKYGKEA